MATLGPRDGGTERRDVVLRAFRARDASQQDAAAASVQRRRMVRLPTAPSSSSSAEKVMLQKDILNIIDVGELELGAIEIQFVRDADGGLRAYVVIP